MTPEVNESASDVHSAYQKHDLMVVLGMQKNHQGRG